MDLDMDIDAHIARADSIIAAQEAALAGAEHHNAFALALHSVLAQPGKNLFYSPLSVRMALAMAAAGARGETAQELHVALFASGADDSCHAALAAGIRQLGRTAGPANVLTIANSLWSQAGAPVLPTFASLIAEHYDGSQHVVDFCGDPAGACQAINGWVSAATRERIQQLLQPSALGIATRLVLANAVYFKCAWERPFKPERTHEAPFYLEAGGSIGAQMMSRVAPFGYRNGPGYQAVTLPYSGTALAMLILLPDKRDSLGILERSLTRQMLGELMRLRPVTRIELFLPRFTLTWNSSLVEALRALGIRLAFTPEADFSGINGHRPLEDGALFVSHVLHKAFSQVNEAGTEAAAATALGIALGIGPRAPAPPPVVRVDRPFFFAIGDAKSGAVLFCGHVADPTRET